MTDTLRCLGYVVTLAAALGAATAANAKVRAKSIWDFGQSGYPPAPGLVADADGNLYGVTAAGGTGPCFSNSGCGTVYRLTPPARRGGQWTYTTLYEFTGGSDGGDPGAPLVIDAKGVIYGYSAYHSAGTVFSLTPGHDGTYDFRVLYNFSGGPDGNLSVGSSPLVVSGRDLYGVAPLGGASGCGMSGCGTFFRLTPGAPGHPWTRNTVITFMGGTAPGLPDWIAGPDSNRAIYLSTAWQHGVIIQYLPTGNRRGTTNIIATFKGHGDGGFADNLVLQPDGSLYGLGGPNNAESGVFQLVQTGGAWVRTTIARLDPHGYSPNSLSAGPGGTLLGTVYGDVDFYYGNVFSLSPPPSGTKWEYRQIWSFTRGPATNPLSVTMGQGPDQGSLFAVLSGGDTSAGTVAEIYNTP